MEILIQEIKTDDAEQVMMLSAQTGYEIDISRTTQNIKHVITNNDNEGAFVAVYDNKIIGWIHIAYVISIESAPFCEIRGIVVDKQHRRHNAGSLLVEKAKQWCGEKNCYKMRVRSNVKRINAHAFYTRIGFTEIKEQKVFEMNI